MSRLRIGAVSFINTKPLVYGLARSSRIELSFDLPGALADDLRSGRLDAALIPVVEYLRGVGEAVVPGVSIACAGKVKSVRLLSRVPAEEIETVAVDRGSRTSVALLRILLSERFGVLPDFHVFAPEAGAWFERFEAVLVIGDRALQEAPETDHEHDLGQLWNDHTGLPFVFAFWVSRSRDTTDELTTLLQASRDDGLRNVEEVAAEAAASSGFDREMIRTYLEDHLHYDLGPEELKGLKQFNRYCLQYHLVPRDRLAGSSFFLENSKLIT